MQYTAADFQHELDQWAGEETPRVRVLKCALRIASRVMVEGVIEATLRMDGATTGTALPGDIPAGMKAPGILSARAVRAVLLEDTGT